MRRLRVPNDVGALIRGLHPDLKRKVRWPLRDIIDDPTIGKLLRDELAGLRSCRVGRFRIVYRSAGAVIEIVAVGPRRTHTVFLRAFAISYARSRLQRAFDTWLGRGTAALAIAGTGVEGYTSRTSTSAAR